MRNLSLLLCSLVFQFACKSQSSSEVPATQPSSQSASQPSSQPSQTQKSELVLTRTEDAITVLSDVHVVDKLYPSMTGPTTKNVFAITEDTAEKLIWITGYKATMTGADGKEPKAQQYMCHSNLDWHEKPAQFAKARVNERVFTLSQGQLNLDLPEGFGIPILSTESLRLTTQVLNMHQPSGVEKVRHRTELKFLRDEDPRAKGIKPLTFRTTAVRVALGDEALVFNELKPTKLQKEASCAPGEDANQGNSPSFDKKGREYSVHWIVPPGRHTYRTLATPELSLFADSRIHYIAVHAHPFIEYVELRDLTTQKTVFRSNAKNFTDSIGIKHIDYYSSQEGTMLYKDHEYEIVAEYNNTSGTRQDAMAIMYVYMHDPNFKRVSKVLPPANEKDFVKIGEIEFQKRSD